ncbi:MAG: aldolase/citrate lyase family protein [candidate division NC10 bacterium]
MYYERSRALKRRLRAGETTFGAWVSFQDPGAAEIMAGTGYDWVFIDTEHSPFSLESLQHVLMAFNGRATVPIVRVPWNDRVRIKQVLDLGAEGILVPMVSSVRESQEAVAACKYPPEGNRGFGPRRASDYYRDPEDYIQAANDGIIVVLQIEHEDGVRQVKEILDAPGIDVICLGPMDLSGSMGILGQLEHPRVVEAIERVLAAAKDRALPVCVPMETSLEAQIAWARKGACFVVTGEDHGLLRRAAADALNRYRAALA